MALALALAFERSLVRSIVLIQRMYYELLRRGALLHFKEYKVTNEPSFYAPWPVGGSRDTR